MGLRQQGGSQEDKVGTLNSKKRKVNKMKDLYDELCTCMKGEHSIFSFVSPENQSVSQWGQIFIIDKSA